MHSSFTLTAVSALAAAGLANPVTWGPPQGSPHGPPASPPWGQPTTYPSGPPAPTSSAPASPSCSGYFEPLAGPYLHDLAQAAGKRWFGSATDQPGTGEDTNILYQEILNDTHI